MNTEYLNYNKLVVQIFCANKSYTVSNINKKGLSTEATTDTEGPHIQSFSLKLVAAGANNTSDTGSTGSLTIVDCNDSVLKFLMSGYKDYPLGGVPKDGTFPRLYIELECFTGKKKWGGSVTDWKVNFSGAVPQIVFNWRIFPIDAWVNSPLIPEKFYDPAALINAVKTRYFKDSKMDFVFLDYSGGKCTVHKNEGVAKFIKFTKGELTLDPSKINTSHPNGVLVAFYEYIAKNICTTDGKEITVASGEELMSLADPQTGASVSFAVRAADSNVVSEENDNTKVIRELVFTYNGNVKPYTKNAAKFFPNKYVIPVDDYSCELDNKKINLNTYMISTINGTYYSGNDGSIGVTSDTTDKDKSAAQKSATSDAQSNSVFTFSFSCYNVAHFQCNNVAAPIEIYVYDESGIKRDYLCVKNALVKEVSYSLDGSVIKANVTCDTAIIPVDPNGYVDPQATPAEDNVPAEDSTMSNG